MASRCTPFTIAESQAPRDVELDDDHVYWVREGAGQQAIERAPRGGGPAETVITATSVARIALDTSFVYFSGDSVQRARKDGTTRPELIYADNRYPNTSALLITAVDLYSATYAAKGSVWRGRKEPGASNAAKLALYPLSWGSDLVANETHIFAADGKEGTPDARIVRLSRQSLTQEVLSRVSVSRLVLAAPHLYFSRAADERIYRIAIDVPAESVDAGVDASAAAWV